MKPFAEMGVAVSFILDPSRLANEMEQSLDKGDNLDINETRQIFDSLDDDKKKEVTKLVQYPLLLTSIIKQASDLIRLNISLEFLSDFEKRICLKLLSLCDTIDNTSFVIDKMIREEYVKFLTELKESEKTVELSNEKE